MPLGQGRRRNVQVKRPRNISFKRTGDTGFSRPSQGFSGSYGRGLPSRENRGLPSNNRPKGLPPRSREVPLRRSSATSDRGIKNNKGCSFAMPTNAGKDYRKPGNRPSARDIEYNIPEDYDYNPEEFTGDESFEEAYDGEPEEFDPEQPRPSQFGKSKKGFGRRPSSFGGRR